MASIELTNIYKSFGKNLIVNNVSLSIENGEFLALVGPSGCGKSTLLRMISGLESIDEGTISIDGEIINHIPPKNRDIAMVFQNYALYPHMSVYDNLSFGLKIKGMKKNEIDKLVMETAKILNIEDLLKRKPKQLSGGQKQRIAVGRAIVRKPKAFLFDEPLSNLDAKLRVKMRTDLLRLHKTQKATSIYVTHDQVEAMTMADRIAIINKGEIQQIDTPLNVYNHPANIFVAGFIGSPSMNFIQGTVGFEDTNVHFKNNTGEINLTLANQFKDSNELTENKEVILGIRPEDFSLEPDSFKPDAFIEANIELIEHMGDISLVHVQVNQNLEWAIKVPPNGKLKIGEKIRLYPDLGKIHFFDNITGKNYR